MTTPIPEATTAPVRRGATHAKARSSLSIVMPPDTSVTVPELLVGAAVLVVAVFGWMSLLLLDNHVDTLPAAAATAAGALLVLLAAARFLSRRPTISTDPWTLGLMAVLAVVAAFMFFPGFSYGITDKDPGVYMALGSAFGRHHSYSFTDVLLQHVGVVEQGPGSRWPGIWLLPHSTTVVPQFYHLWPALLAMAYDMGGLRLESQVAPLLGVLSVCAFVVLVRRAVPGRASLPAAAVGGLLLVTNMMQVWQAKYPSTEILAQLLFLTILLAVCVSLSTGWRPAAGAGGLLLGIGWLERPDMLLLVGIVAVTGAALVALRRADSRVTWFAGGFAVVLPHALWQAYAGARQYTLANGVPTLSKLVAGAVALAVVALALRTVRPVSVTAGRLLTDRTWQFWLGVLVCALVAALMALGFLRPRLFGADMGNVAGAVQRTYNEQNMRRLSWFLTLGAFPLAGIGLALVALRRWRAASWAAVLPALLVSPVFVKNARVAPRLMWWVRRFVPEVLPGMILLMAVALGVALVWRFRQRRILAIPALAAAGALIGIYAHQSWPLRHHNEFGGSFQVTAEMAATAGDSQGIFLFGQKGCCTTPEYMFGAGLWLERNQLDALMPPGAAAPGYVQRVAAAMPGHPVFVVWGGTAQPPLGSLSMVAVRHITASLPMWEETQTSRPRAPRPPIPVDFTIWRVAGTGAA